jgi:hypothetical protein
MNKELAEYSNHDAVFYLPFNLVRGPGILQSVGQITEMSRWLADHCTHDIVWNHGFFGICGAWITDADIAILFKLKF